ncbi:MAG: glycosyl transferase, partial [Nocardioidaceae bacterium]|nr:glycosyl transferase [Nocardioidaceae bacterium]
AAILGITVSLLWRIRGTATGSLGFASLIAAAGIWSFSLLGDSGSSLRRVLLAVTAASALILCLHAVMELSRLVTSAVIVGMVFSLGGTAAYTVDTALTAHSGSIPTVSMSGSGGMGGGGMGVAMGGGPGQSTTDSSTSTNSSSSSSASSVEELLAATTSRWSAAVNGSQSAATLELSSNTSVMAIGGWSGDPTPTLAEFQAYVKAGDVSYYISSGQGGGPGGSSSSSSAIATWVADNYTATTVGNSTVYDLSS